MNFELYHDESLIGGYWHGMLLVPVSAKYQIVKILDVIRKNSGYSAPLGIKSVSTRNRVYDCAFAWITVGVAVLRSNQKGAPIPIFLGKDKQLKPKYDLFYETIGAKFILFRERDSHIQMTGHKDHASRIETTFRMGLKGGMHYLGSEEDPIRISGLHFDGHKHHHRHIDKTRIIDRIEGLRSYCKIENLLDIIDDRSSDHRKSDSQPYIDCQLLQLTDLLIGSFRSSLGHYTKELHLKLAYPVQSLISKYRKGYARMRNSRWRNAFCMSECYLDDGAWNFGTIECEEIPSSVQMSLDFANIGRST